jgi:hypothetical protein
MWYKEEQEQQTYELLPDGKYEAIVHNATIDETKTPYVLKVTYEIVEEGKYKNRKLFQQFTFQESAKKYLMWQLGVLGAWQFGKAANSEEEAVRLMTQAVFNMVNEVYVMLKVSRREYEGKEYQNAIVDHVIDKFDGSDSPVNQPKKELVNHAPVSPPVTDLNEEIPF